MVNNSLGEGIRLQSRSLSERVLLVDEGGFGEYERDEVLEEQKREHNHDSLLSLLLNNLPIVVILYAFQHLRR
jgi:hypothetical protein